MTAAVELIPGSPLIQSVTGINLSSIWNPLCSWSADLSPSIAALTYDNTSQQLSLQPTNACEVGDFEVRLIATPTLWPFFVSDASYGFQVSITCPVTSLTYDATHVNIAYEIGSSQ